MCCGWCVWYACVWTLDDVGVSSGWVMCCRGCGVCVVCMRYVCEGLTKRMQLPSDKVYQVGLISFT